MSQDLRPVLGVAAVALLIACTGASTSSFGHASSAEQAGTEWATPFLGQAPKASVAQHPALYPNREWWGVLTASELPDPADTSFMRCAQADLYSTIDLFHPGEDAWILVLHGVPSWIDPLRPFGHDSLWGYVGQAPSGTRMYGLYEGATLFVLSSSTWVISSAAQVSDRLAATFSSAPREPPLLPASPGSIVDGSWLTGPVTEYADGSLAAAIEVYPPSQSGFFPFVGKTLYVDSTHAGAAAESLRGRLRHLTPAESTDYPHGLPAVTTQGSTLVTRGTHGMRAAAAQAMYAIRLGPGPRDLGEGP